MKLDFRTCKPQRQVLPQILHLLICNSEMAAWAFWTDPHRKTVRSARAENETCIFFDYVVSPVGRSVRSGRSNFKLELELVATCGRKQRTYNFASPRSNLQANLLHWLLDGSARKKASSASAENKTCIFFDYVVSPVRSVGRSGPVGRILNWS